ncbi:MAG: hypothetical protein LIP18_01395 [Planctomycetes bacterium]|nr:hypothetical protein [Planctomycetota bacterium]MCD7896964.1 hypothetical protein [Planctomycetaceae bacterium]
MPDCVIVPAVPGHVDHVLRNLRPEHVREIRDATGLPVGAAVRASVADSSVVLAGVAGGEALFLVGVSKSFLLSDTGSVWMVATSAIDDHAIPAALALRELFRQAHRLTGTRRIEQWLPWWYRKGVKWLLWLGWKADGTRVIHGVPHHRMIHEEATDELE